MVCWQTRIITSFQSTRSVHCDAAARALSTGLTLWSQTEQGGAKNSQWANPLGKQNSHTAAVWGETHPHVVRHNAQGVNVYKLVKPINCTL